MLLDNIITTLEHTPERLHIMKVYKTSSNCTSYYKLFYINDIYSITDITRLISEKAHISYSEAKQAIMVRGCNYCKPDYLIDCIWNSMDLKSPKPHYPAYIIGD